MRYAPLRRATQVLSLLVLLVLPLANALGFTRVRGSLLAARVFGLPLADPLAAAQVAASSFSASASLLVGAGLILGLAALLGAAFCGWMCPYGLLAEMGLALRRAGRVPGRPGRNPALATRTLLVGLWLAAAALTGLPPLLDQLSLPAWLSRFPMHLALFAGPWDAGLWFGAGLVLAALGTDLALGRRLWCRRLCPQAVLLHLARRLSPRSLRVRFHAARCSCLGDSPCRAACPLDLEPRSRSLVQSPCTNCLACVDRCRREGVALAPGFGPGPGAGSSSGPGSGRN